MGIVSTTIMSVFAFADNETTVRHFVASLVLYIFCHQSTLYSTGTETHVLLLLLFLVLVLC
jgi:hypothetical protein